MDILVDLHNQCFVKIMYILKYLMKMIICHMSQSGKTCRLSIFPFLVSGVT